MSGSGQKIIFAIRALSLPGRRKLQPWLSCQLPSLTSSTGPSCLYLLTLKLASAGWRPIRQICWKPPNLLETNASIERIIRDARAADQVMQHIRGLFKQESFEKKQVSIRDVLSEAVRFVRGDPRKHDVSIDWQLDEHLPRVSVDLTQIQQVFINLISNAMEALEGSQISPQKIAAITLTLWKRAERFDAEQLKTQAA